ncbi:MAG: type II toxin-antitoxin system HicA family toxin [Lachnospiraceae bacterium]|nr:type II toxin-antitoxin system HicA family toxin [Lachnospiraceae bacterium]
MPVGQKEKLIRKLQSKPKDFTFEEAEKLLGYFDYRRSDKGRTSGSRVMFICEDRSPILLHKPHPRKELLEYQVKQLIEKLKEEDLI